MNTVCPGSSYPFYIVSYYIKWVTLSWTHSTYERGLTTDDQVAYDMRWRGLAYTKHHGPILPQKCVLYTT